MKQIREVPTNSLKPHPEAHLVPGMKPEEWESFYADIEENGIKDAIVLDSDGFIIDGRHRHEAAKGLEYTVVPVVDAELGPNETPRMYMLKAAVLRRHLTTSQIAMVAVLEGVKAAWDSTVAVVGPNHDAGNHGVWTAIKEACVGTTLNFVSHAEFINLMAYAEVLVGNSSAGIREACYFGTPVVDVGSRQQGRTPVGMNVNPASLDEVYYQTLKQLSAGKYVPEYLYGDGTAGQQIAKILAEVELPNIQKRFYD